MTSDKYDNLKIYKLGKEKTFFNKINEKSEPIFFISAFTILFCILCVIELPKQFGAPLCNLCIIFFIRSLMSAGTLDKKDSNGIKSILIRVLFPCLVFNCLSQMTFKQLKELWYLPVLGILHSITLFIFGAGITYSFWKARFFPWSEALMIIFQFGALAPVASAYPFSNQISKDSLGWMVLLDFGNKIWSLTLIAFIINFWLAEKSSFSVLKIISPVLKIPMIWAFILALLFLFTGVKIEALKIGAEMITSLAKMCNVMTMIFIGLKIQVPSLKNIKIIFPIFYRRLISLLFVIFFQLIVGFNEKMLQTLLVFSQAANSIFAYVHLNKAVEDDDPRANKEFMLQLVAYDYTIAIFMNMALSNCEIKMDIIIILLMILIFLTSLFAFYLRSISKQTAIESIMIS